MGTKTVVLDANILVRAVLGTKARELVIAHAASTRFFAPDVAYQDARKYLPGLLEKRHMDPGPAMAVLDHLERIVLPVEYEVYAEFQQAALQRIAVRDADDWPVLACALCFDCPVWTEDTDFFGTGVATWTSDRIALFLA